MGSNLDFGFIIGFTMFVMGVTMVLHFPGFCIAVGGFLLLDAMMRKN